MCLDSDCVRPGNRLTGGVSRSEGVRARPVRGWRDLCKGLNPAINHFPSSDSVAVRLLPFQLELVPQPLVRHLLAIAEALLHHHHSIPACLPRQTGLKIFFLSVDSITTLEAQHRRRLGGSTRSRGTRYAPRRMYVCMFLIDMDQLTQPSPVPRIRGPPPAAREARSINATKLRFHC